MQKRIEEERARIEEQQLTEAESRQHEAEKHVSEYNEYCERVVNDPRWHEMKLLARHPLLHEALEAYINQFFPSRSSFWGFRHIRQSIKVDESPVWTYNGRFRIEHGYESNHYEVDYTKKGIEGARIFVSGISINWIEKIEKIVIRVIVRNENDYQSGEYKSFETVEEFADFIAQKIAQNKQIDCMRDHMRDV